MTVVLQIIYISILPLTGAGKCSIIAVREGEVAMKTKTNKFIKNICKTAAVMGIGLVMAVSAMQTTFASADTFAGGIISRNAPQRRGAIGLTITGQLPRAATGNRDLDEMLNNRFTAQFNAFVDEHMGRAATITFAKDVIVSDDFVSVIIDMAAISATTTNARATTVINTETMEIINISDYNLNALPLINGNLHNLISASPRLFVTNFTAIDNYHPFYFDGDLLVIPFASGEFSLADRGIFTKTFTRTNIRNEIVESDLFTVLGEEQYGTIMVRIAPVADLFGFEYTWDADVHAHTLTKGDFVVMLAVGENTHGLELAPMIINGSVHVPLSFFREVLGIVTTVLSDDEILMTMYQ